jgi:hypothetical protein
MSSIRSSAPTLSAPAASAFGGLLALREHRDACTSLPVPEGSDTMPRTIWSAWRGSTPRFIANFDRLVELGRGKLAQQLERLGEI